MREEEEVEVEVEMETEGRIDDHCLNSTRRWLRFTESNEMPKIEEGDQYKHKKHLRWLPPRARL